MTDAWHCPLSLPSSPPLRLFLILRSSSSILINSYALASLAIRLWCQGLGDRWRERSWFAAQQKHPHHKGGEVVGVAQHSSHLSPPNHTRSIKCTIRKRLRVFIRGALLRCSVVF
jgi:hypothetical protein